VLETASSNAFSDEHGPFHVSHLTESVMLTTHKTNVSLLLSQNVVFTTETRRFYTAMGRISHTKCRTECPADYIKKTSTRPIGSLRRTNSPIKEMLDKLAVYDERILP
jgi:hypothetical protein